MDAIIVAADHFKNLSEYNVENKKIILMTNFKVPTQNDPKDVQLVSFYIIYIRFCVYIKLLKYIFAFIGFGWVERRKV